LQEATNEDLLDFCRRKVFPLIGFAPFLKGGVASRPGKSLRSEYVGEDSNVRLALLNEVAGELGITPPQLVLAWMRHHEAPIVPLIGVSSVSQMNESIDAMDIRLDKELMDRLSQGS
jgi:aryl-alcohol dehydrogenase-like predicted oxidoreductase